MKTIIVNKNMQDKLNINIMNYKLFGGKYIIYETKNKGKEYDYNDELLYEGEFLHGKRNGKGKEYINRYDKDEVIFEGNYLNGKRNGPGKEYGYLNLENFEGEYLNGERWNGKVKVYGTEEDEDESDYEYDYEYEYDNSYYIEIKEDQYLNGERFEKITDINGNILKEMKNLNGLMKEYYDKNNIKFEGEYLNGKRNGKGKEFDKKGNLIFEGEYLDGKRNGKGKEYFIKKLRVDDEEKRGRGRGRGRGGKETGRKRKKYISELIFEGEYLNGKRWKGKGKDYHDYNSDDILFEGEYLNGKRWNGKGVELGDEGLVLYEGEYFNGKKINIIHQYIPKNGLMKDVKECLDHYNILIYEAEYLNDKKCGKGKEYNDKGTLLFEGEFLYNFKLKGKEYINGKLEYEGEYFFFKKWNGKGYDANGKVIYEINNGTGYLKEYDKQGKLIFEGEVLNGRKNGKGKEYSNSLNCFIDFEGEYLNGKRWNGKQKHYWSYGSFEERIIVEGK